MCKQVRHTLKAKHPVLPAASDAENIVVLLIESWQRMQKLPYQRKRLVLLLSAMRHYADDLRAQRYTVDYVQVDNFMAGWQQHVAHHNPTQVVTMAAAAYNGRNFQQTLQSHLNIPVTILPNTQFLVGQHNPIPNPQPDKRHVMETFYRQMRQHFDLLMDGNQPARGQWNFDKENRKKLPKGDEPKRPLSFPPDTITQQVMAEIAALPNGVGTVEDFNYAVTRTHALAAVDDFVSNRLPKFGDYEDAMTQRSHVVYHSLLSPYLNIGLLEPLELAYAAEKAYRENQAPINAVEGFVRQIVGWREFMYWQYWRQMPGMLQKNAWEAKRPLPPFVWTGDTDMACLHHAISRAIETGYNHHIERLMLLSNFFMLAGINPKAVNDWFMSLYIDATDWVMPPNVIGMGLNADGGLTATKPYIASANYINKMGDHCKGCRFNPKQRHGDDACPFNYLYWNFILQHEEKLRANPRTSRNVLGLRHLDANERKNVQQQAKIFFDSIG